MGGLGFTAGICGVYHGRSYRHSTHREVGGGGGFTGFSGFGFYNIGRVGVCKDSFGWWACMIEQEGQWGSSRLSVYLPLQYALELQDRYLLLGSASRYHL